MKIEAREGDVIETTDQIFFDVKGLVHPPDRIIAFPRFVPDLEADRKRGEVTYRKIYALSEALCPTEKIFSRILGLRSSF